MLKTLILIFALAAFSFGCSKNSGSVAPGSTPTQSSGSSTQAAQNVVGELRSKVPDGWTTEKPTSEMRVAQYKLPHADGDPEDALLVVYYFGKGQGGSADANIERWINQVKQPDGQPSQDRAKIGSQTVNGLPVKTVDVSGNYGGGMSPDSAPTNNKTIYRLRGAVVETPKGSYFVKLTGPENTIKRWEQAYNDYLQSLEFK
jgi:hypothetical protein